MAMCQRTHFLALLGAVISSATFASASTSSALLEKQGLQVRGSIPVRITLDNHQTKIVQLMNVVLSKSAAHQLSSHLAGILAHPTQKNMMQASDVPPQKYDGMNGEPVLDQGEWGTCATFATTGAINALYPLIGDASISQLCNLEFGRTLNDPNVPDGGWNGSFGYLVLDQISQYGYIDFKYQTQVGCGGLKAYPTYSGDNGSAMPAEEFNAHSHHDFTGNDWAPIWKYDGSFSPLDPDTATQVLTQVKQTLNQGNRVLFGTLVDMSVNQVGVSGSYDGVNLDTWVMTPQIQQDVQHHYWLGGHEIIIDGYDDNACATYQDEKGQPQQQCGLLRIRNSWSDRAGDHGDYYMSYDHFRGMAVEVYAIGQNAKSKTRLIK